MVSVYCMHYVWKTLDNSKYSNTDTIIIIINNNSNRSSNNAFLWTTWKGASLRSLMTTVRKPSCTKGCLWWFGATTRSPFLTHLHTQPLRTSSSCSSLSGIYTTSLPRGLNNNNNTTSNVHRWKVYLMGYSGVADNTRTSCSVSSSL